MRLLVFGASGQTGREVVRQAVDAGHTATAFVRRSRAAVGPVPRFRCATTIVRPPKLTGGPLTGTYRSGEGVSTWAPVPMLSRADVAHFMLQTKVGGRHVHQAPRLLR